MPTRYVVQGAQTVMPFEMPASVAEHALIGVGGDDFGEEQVVLLVIARLRQQTAFEPGDAVFEQRRFDLFARKRLQAVSLKFVLPLGLGDVQTRRIADGLHDVGLIDAGDVEHEGAGRFEQLAGQVDLSRTTATFGGSKSSGIAQAAAMMLR